MRSNTIYLNYGPRVGDPIPPNVMKEYLGGHSGAIGNWIHDQYEGCLNYQNGKGADMNIFTMPWETKSYEISSKNSSWTIGTSTTKDILTTTYKDIPISDKCKFMILVGYDVKRYVEISSIDTVDLSNSIIQSKLEDYYEIARQDILSKIASKPKSYEKMGDSTGAYFERRELTEVWAFRITKPTMKNLISLANFYSNPCFG
jgi:hypothetical protein